MVKIMEEFSSYYRESFVKYTIWRVAMGLKVMHKHDIIHRDIKLDNILCDSKGTIKIADLDHSVMLTRKRPCRTTMIVGGLGAVNYRPPEVIN